MTRVCYDLGIEWRLGALYRVRAEHMRKTERIIKDRNNGPRYCRICQPYASRGILRTEEIPVSMLDFPTTSKELRNQTNETLPRVADEKPHEDSQIQRIENDEIEG